MDNRNPNRIAAHSQIPRTAARLLGGDRLNVAYIGGSVTQATGASDTTETSWRALFQKYLYQRYHRKYFCHIGSMVSGIGSCNSPVMAFLIGRHILPNEPMLAFVEFCINDAHVLDKELVKKGIEGMVRQLVTAKKGCDVVFLRAGCSPRSKTADGNVSTIPDGLHRQIAEYYDLPLIDLQGFTNEYLAEKGERWDDVIPPVNAREDLYHLNDYGNSIYFDAIRETFEKHMALFRQKKHRDPFAPIPEPLFSDELQYVRLLDPSIKNRSIELEGEWHPKPRELVPWYTDNLLVGQPGAKMTVVFQGTSVMVWALCYNNGLKVQALLNGEKISGPFLKYPTEFCRGFVLAHGMPHREHVLELTVGQPGRRQNRLENPTAQIGAVGITNRQ